MKISIEQPFAYSGLWFGQTLGRAIRLGCLFACVFTASVWAAPFDKQFEFTQPDGARIQLHGRGDELYARFETLDGYTVVFDRTQGAYCFARQDAKGGLVSTGVQVQRGDPAGLGLAKGVRMSNEARRQLVAERYKLTGRDKIDKRWQERKAAMSQFYASGGGSSPSQNGGQPSPPSHTTTGLKVGLTLLVDFSDDPATIPQADIVNFCNGDNYTGYGNNGSVKQYFYDVSGGLLTYTNVVTVYVRVPQPKSYYNDESKDAGTQGNLLIKDALDALKALPNYTSEILPTFTPVTVDNNNQVVAFNVFFAGASSRVWAMGLWPHQGFLVDVGSQELSPGGKQVWIYEITDIGNTLGIGTFCHENGHMLCDYPDLYDYEYDSIGGAGYYSLMGAGNFDHNPVQIDAYLKRASGWGNTTELNSFSSLVASLSVAPGTNLNQFYRYQRPGVPTEYYIIENRQRVGHDAMVPGVGIAIWHVDELGDRDNQSLAYNATHANYELTLVQADNLWHFENNVNFGDPQDLYYAGNPAMGYANQFSDGTAPSARWWDGSSSSFFLSDFSVNARTMTLQVGTAGALANLAVVTNYAVGGNGNGVIDPNECEGLLFVLANVGAIGATNVSVALSTTNADVVIAQAISPYPDLPPGSAATNFVPFNISVSPSFICGAPINLTLTVKSDQGTFTRPYVLGTGVAGIPLRFDSSSLIRIPDLGQTNSTVVVSNIDFAVTKVVVSLYLDHMRDADLVLRLVSPGGVTNVLSSMHGDSGRGYGVGCYPDSLRTTFDDQATNSIALGIAPFFGSYQPDQPLSVFAGAAGTNVNGPWQLLVSDVVGGVSGTLACWSLLLTPSICTNGGGECPGSDLAIGMKALPQPVLVGGNLTYTISVTNRGPSSANAVTVSQVLPTSVIFLSATSSQGSCSEAGGVVTANLGRMGANRTATITVQVMPVIVSRIACSANVASEQSDFDPSNNSVTVLSDVLPPTADLAVGLVAAPTSLIMGDTVTYTVSVINNGPSSASGVTVTNVLPLGLVALGESVSQGSVAAAGNTIVCFFGALANGARATATITATPVAQGTMTATATLNATPNQFDPVAGNNFASSTITVSPAADLAVGLVVSPNPAVVTSNVTFVATVTNLGPSSANSVTLNQNLPPGTAPQVVSATLSQGTVSYNGDLLACDLGSLAPGATATLTVVLRTTVAANLMSSVAASASETDPNRDNNSAQVTAVVAPPFVCIFPAGAVLVSESFLPPNGSVDVGETVTINFRLQNVGNVQNTNLVATLLATNGVASPSGAQVYDKLLPGGAPKGMPFTFTASGTNGGTIQATLSLQDSGGYSTNAVFSFALPGLATLNNTNTILIPDPSLTSGIKIGPALPYPSAINVSGISDQVGKVTVTLYGLTHTYAQDVNVLLVGPTGAKALLMSHAGFPSSVDNAYITFDDGASMPLPDLFQITSGAYQPAAYGSAVIFSNPAPPGPYSAALTNFSGLNPNGTWSLYVLDDSEGDSGYITNGWGLTLTTVTPVNQLADVGLSVTASPDPVMVGSNLTYTFVISNAGPSAAAGVMFSNALPAGVTLVSASASRGTCVTSAGLVTDSISSLGAGGTATVTVVVNVGRIAAGQLVNTASVTSYEADLHLADNVASIASTIIRPTADVAIGLAASPSLVTFGSNVVYTMVVTNSGPGAALDVVVADALPSTTAYVSASVSQGTVAINGRAFAASLGDLPPGASAAVTLTLTALGIGPLTNTVSVSAFSTDPVLDNDSAAAVVTVVNPAPRIAAAGAVLVVESFSPPNGAVDPGENVSVSLILTNSGALDTANLVATLLPSGGVTSPSAAATYGRVVAGGPTVARTFSFTASAAASGSIVATLQLQDGPNDLGTLSFTFYLPGTGTFANTTPIAIPDHGSASPYPSIINVSGVTGLVSKASITLNSLTHSFPKDVNVLLVSPSGAKVLLMSHAGGPYALTNVNLVFDKAALAALPNGTRIAPGTYLPSAYGAVAFPAPAGAAPYGADLSAIEGADPNGIWALYVFDDSLGDSGSITGGWGLNLTTVNPVNPLADLAVGMTSTPALVLAGSPVTYTLTVTNFGPASAQNVVVNNALPTGFTVISSDTSQGTISISAGALMANLGSLAAGSTATVTFSAAPATGGSFLDIATVSGICTDLNSLNNSAQAATTVLSAMPVRLTGTFDNGLLQITVSGQPGLTYAIEASTNLTSWLSICTNTASANGTFIYQDTDSPSFKARFYRAMRQIP